PGSGGVRQALEYDHARAFGQERAVRAGVERPDHLTRAQGTELGEHAPQRRVVTGVHAACEHRVAPSRGQVRHRVVHPDERGGTRRVPGGCGPGEVETVRDTGRGEVRHQPDRGWVAVTAELRAERVRHLGEPVLAETGHEVTQHGGELVDHVDTLVQPGNPG